MLQHSVTAATQCDGCKHSVNCEGCKTVRRLQHSVTAADHCARLLLAQFTRCMSAQAGNAHVQKSAERECRRLAQLGGMSRVGARGTHVTHIGTSAHLGAGVQAVCDDRQRERQVRPRGGRQRGVGCGGQVLQQRAGALQQGRLQGQHGGAQLRHRSGV